MFVAAVLIALAPCHHGLTVAQAKALALATPSIRAAVVQNHAKPFFDGVTPRPNGWGFDVNSRTLCAHPDRPCSSLLGHFAVSRNGEVEDLDADGGAGAQVKSAELRRLRKHFVRNHC